MKYKTIPIIPVKIEKVLELAWETFSPPRTSKETGIIYYGGAYAHIGTARDYGERKEYVLLAMFPRHGMAFLGDIDLKTKRFEVYDQNNPAHYVRASNHVINEISASVDQLNKVRTLREILQTKGISIKVKRTLVPK